MEDRSKIIKELQKQERQRLEEKELKEREASIHKKNKKVCESMGAAVYKKKMALLKMVDETTRTCRTNPTIKALDEEIWGFISKIKNGGRVKDTDVSDTITGETRCDPENPNVLERMDFLDPVIKVTVEPKTKVDIDKMAAGLLKLAQEDPTFRFSRDEEINETTIEAIGESHLESIIDRLRTEFKVEADVGALQINYREIISKIAEVKYVHKKQSGGKGKFADITVRFEPMEAGTGYEFKSEIKGGAIPKEYIAGVMKGLEECMSNGVLAGYPVVDVRAVLVDGSYHDVDSSVLALQLAARGAFRKGMRKARPRMLEPIMKVEVVTPEEHLVDVIGDLNSRRGQINNIGDKPGGLKVVDALVPLAEMFQYVSTLRGMTKGRASYSMQPAKFDVVPQHIQNQLAV